MPIVALILSTLGFWTLFWFVRMGGIDHVRNRNAQRKAQQSEEARQSSAREAARNAPLRAVDDPRDAATILMLVLARGEGEATPDQLAAIESIARAEFGVDDDWVGRMTQARFIASRTESFEQAASVFTDLFDRCLTPDERRQLVNMLQQVAPERPTVTQIATVAAFKRQLGIASA